MAIAAVFFAAAAVSAFAASMKPILSVSYKIEDGKTSISLSAKAPDDKTAKILERAVFDTGAEAFRFGQESEAKGKLTQDIINESRVSVGDGLYKMELINSDAIQASPEEAAVELKYELVPSSESMSDQIETVEHKQEDLAYEDIYYVNDVETSADEYEQIHMDNICNEEKEKSEKIAEKGPVKGSISFDGKTAQGVNCWRKDVYYHTVKTVTTTHRLYVLTAKADEAIPALRDSEYSKYSYLPLMAKEQSRGYNEIGLSWNLIDNADEYLVYRSQCGKTKYKRVAATKGEGFTSIRKLKKNTYYKFLIVAVDSHGKIGSVSPSVHVATKGGRFNNPSKLSVSKKSMSVKRGKSVKIKTKVKYSGVKVHVPLRYVSTDKGIATVSKSGKIKGVSKGTCDIYVYAQNGLAKKLSVKVK